MSLQAAFPPHFPLPPTACGLAKGKVIAGDLTTTLEDKYFMKSHKQIKDESQTQQQQEKMGKKENQKSLCKKEKSNGKEGSI